MWIVVNNADLTGIINHDSIQIDQSLSDPLPTASFLVNDPGCHLNLQVGQPVIIWDENAAPDYTFAGRAVQTIPTLNILKNNSFLNNGQYWTAGGTNAGLITYNFSNFYFAVTFNNTASGQAYLHQITPANYISAGTPYCLSVYITGSGTLSNVQYFTQIKWLDTAQNVISTSTFGPTTLTSTTQFQFANDPTQASAVAPTGAVYADIYIGAQPSVSGSNSGSIHFSNAQFEPAWFIGQTMGNGSPVVYPSPDCNNAQATSIVMPDGTCSRSNRIFAGYIKNMEVDYTNGGVSREYTIDCGSYGDLVENGALINKSYTNQSDASIISDIVTTYYSGVLSTGQQNTSSPTTTLVAGQIVNEVSYVDQTFREVLNALTDLTGFSFFVDAFGYVHYNDTPFDYAPWGLSDAPDNVTSFAPQQFQVYQDGTQLRNSIKVTGGQLQVTASDTFSGNGSSKVFTLTSVPDNISNISIGGTTYAPTSANKIGTAGTDTNGQNGIVAVFDAQAQTLTFNTAPASGTNNVVVTYPTQRNVSVLVEDNASIAKYGRKFMSKVNDSTLISNATAKTRGEAEIAKYAYPLVNLKFYLYHYAAPGTSILVTSQYDGFTNQPFVIQTVTATYLGGGTNQYQYEAGVYRPSLNDHLRNTAKAIARNTSVSGTTTVLQTYEVVTDTTSYSDRATITVVTPPAPKWGTGLYGYFVWN